MANSATALNSIIEGDNITDLPNIPILPSITNQVNKPIEKATTMEITWDIDSAGQNNESPSKQTLCNSNLVGQSDI